MKRKHILYLTTNAHWGGSEILWSESANKFIEKGFFVKAGTFYDYDFINHSLSGKEQYLDLRERYIPPNIVKRGMQKLKFGNFHPNDKLSALVHNHKPDLAVISQGNIKDALGLMEFCSTNNIPYVNIIHMVSESLWPALDDQRINQLNSLFSEALVNYFVSEHTRKMQEALLGKKIMNAEPVYNPFIKNVPEHIPFPIVKDGHYKVALIGRLENFHKGYDLLIDVVKQEKWRQRNIGFSIFGKGPHLDLLQRTIKQHSIKNIFIRDHVENIAAIWKDHHLLMMPSRMEGQSLSLIEAMRFKRAVVTTNVGGVEELIEEGKTGFIAKYPTVEHIDTALENAWNARHSWEQMGLEAYQSIQQRHPADAVAYFNEKLEALLMKYTTE